MGSVQRNRYRLGRFLDEVEWQVIMRDGAFDLTDGEVGDAIAYLEGVADWIMAPKATGSICQEPAMATLVIEHWKFITGEEEFGYVFDYLEAAAMLRDGWMPSKKEWREQWRARWAKAQGAADE